MSEALEVIGCLAAAGALSVSLLASDPRLRVAGLVLAGALALALIAGQGWDDLRNLREHHLAFAGPVVAGIVVLAIGAAAMLRWPILLPLLVVATLPFRVRLHVAGGAGRQPAGPALRRDRLGRAGDGGRDPARADPPAQAAPGRWSSRWSW